MNYVTGNTIKELREKKNLTQKQLAEILQVSDKTISKWETNRGLPDISLISSLAEGLGVSVAELLIGEVAENTNKTGNMKKVQFYVCPVCGNVIQAMTKEHYISFIAYVTSNHSEIVKMYPEQSVECRFAKRGHGFFYGFCNKHGLFRYNI